MVSVQEDCSVSMTQNKCSCDAETRAKLDMVTCQSFVRDIPFQLVLALRYVHQHLGSARW